jgi:hypothetical protein
MTEAREQPIRTLHCYASGRDGDWEAICLDLDIAVQGSSFDDVRRSLHEAVSLYLESVATLPEDQQGHLLHRTAPPRSLSVSSSSAMLCAPSPGWIAATATTTNSRCRSPRERSLVYLNSFLSKPDCRIIAARVPGLMSSLSRWNATTTIRT